MDAAEQSLLRDTVRVALERAADGDADARLVEIGWLDMLDAEPDLAIEAVFTALGATNANATALDDVLASALGEQPRSSLAVLLPAFAMWDAPGLNARGLATARVLSAKELLVVSSNARLHVVPMSVARVTAVQGIDPDAQLSVVEIDEDVASSTRIDKDVWDMALAVGRRALALQISGAAHTMLELARTHSLTRVQFGRPVGQFQAVRHRLAESLVAIEALDAALAAAADTRCPETALLAKAVAGRTARTVAAHCQQVLAGIGFTTEHAFHRYLKRTILLDGLLGSSDDLALVVGRRLMDDRAVPTLIEL
jgi:hypothetical protein